MSKCVGGDILQVGNGVARGCLAHLGDRGRPTWTSLSTCRESHFRLVYRSRDSPSIGTNSKDARSLPTFWVDAVPRKEGPGRWCHVTQGD